MPVYSGAFSGFAVKNADQAKDFYSKKLGLAVEQDQMGLTLKLTGGLSVFVYEKPDHIPASYTILNLVVDDIDTAIDELQANGVQFEHYDDLPAPQDKKGVLRGLAAKMGPDIAWFKDPSGNIFGLLQQA